MFRFLVDKTINLGKRDALLPGNAAAAFVFGRNTQDVLPFENQLK